MLMGKANGIEGGFVRIDLCGEAQDTACVSHDVARPLARLFGCSSLFCGVPTQSGQQVDKGRRTQATSVWR